MIETPPEPLPAQEQVIEQKLLDCGLKVGGFTVKYEDYLDGIEVVITPVAGATPDHFDCIRGSIYPEFVRFEDYAMYDQYMAYEADLVRPQVLAEVEAALKERDLRTGSLTEQLSLQWEIMSVRWKSTRALRRDPPSGWRVTA